MRSNAQKIYWPLVWTNLCIVSHFRANKSLCDISLLFHHFKIIFVIFIAQILFDFAKDVYEIIPECRVTSKAWFTINTRIDISIQIFSRLTCDAAFISIQFFAWIFFFIQYIVVSPTMLWIQFWYSFKIIWFEPLEFPCSKYRGSRLQLSCSGDQSIR